MGQGCTDALAAVPCCPLVGWPELETITWGGEEARNMERAAATSCLMDR